MATCADCGHDNGLLCFPGDCGFAFDDETEIEKAVATERSRILKCVADQVLSWRGADVLDFADLITGSILRTTPKDES